MKIPYGSNKVLIQTLEKNTEQTTPSGIIKISATDTDWDHATHADRWGKVIHVPSGLKYDRFDGGALAWYTDIEVAEGMLVWYDYLNSLNCTVLLDEDESEYRLIEYGNLYVALVPVGSIYEEFVDKDIHGLNNTKTDWVIPLNGYVLFERIDENAHTTLWMPPKIDKTKGVVKYVGRRIMEYQNGKGDVIDLRPGDTVQFKDAYEVLLEDKTYSTFDGGVTYRRAQRNRVACAWRGDKIIVPSDCVLVDEQKEELETEMGIKLLKGLQKQSLGYVMEGGGFDLGDQVIFIKGAGVLIKWDDVTYRLLLKDHIELLVVNS